MEWKDLRLRMVAVFWYIDDDFVGIEDTLNGMFAERYGDYIRVNVTHEELWEDIKDEYGGVPYDYFPRGRIIFNTKSHRFMVVCERSIADNPIIADRVLSHYGLPESTIFDIDRHYAAVP